MAVYRAGVIPNRRKVVARFIATPPGNRVIRPGTSEPSRIDVAERPMMSHSTDPMQRMSGVMVRFLRRTPGKTRGCE